MDRNAYITYLETQLERTASACLTVQNFTDRMNLMDNQIVSIEERIINLTRVIKMIQAGNEENIPLNVGVKEFNKGEVLVLYYTKLG